MLRSRKIFFSFTEIFAVICLVAWVVLTIAFFSSWFSIQGFPKIDLTVESASDKRISTIPGLSTVAQVGSVIIFISSAILIIYFGLMMLFYWIKINRTKIFYMNMVFYGISITGIVLGILFVCLNL